MSAREPSIPLSPDRGLNPRMTVCTRCGEDTPLLALLGTGDYLHTCTCGAHSLGPKNLRKCNACGLRGHMRMDRRLDDYEKLPMGLCDKCEANDAAMKKMVEEGGIYWKCSDCGSGGAIRCGSELAQAAREQSGIKAPDPVGVEFSKDDCPVCGPNPVEQP